MSVFAQEFRLKPGQLGQVPTLTGPQQQIINQLLQGLGGPLGSGLQNLQNILGGSPEAFRDFERPALRQFQEEIIPNIAERFAGAGAGSSSGFQQTLARAGERLSENLAGQRANLQNQALSQLLNLLGTGTRPQFQNLYQPRGPGFGAAFGQGLGSALGRLPGLLGGLF